MVHGREANTQAHKRRFERFYHWSTIMLVSCSSFNGTFLGSDTGAPETCLPISFCYQRKHSRESSCPRVWEEGLRMFISRLCPTVTFVIFLNAQSFPSCPTVSGGDDLRKLVLSLPFSRLSLFLPTQVGSLWPSVK